VLSLGCISAEVFLITSQRNETEREREKKMEGGNTEQVRKSLM